MTTLGDDILDETRKAFGPRTYRFVGGSFDGTTFESHCCPSGVLIVREGVKGEYVPGDEPDTYVPWVPRGT